ncbi:hypothetical protein CAG54_03415 [Vibrio sp. V27_P1S3P104]|nr:MULTISPECIES: hypothetical protein [Vibrio]NAW69356.1 hypothetical protein [Vibrio sp. V28_P6S34P95]NAX05179.1 hypothetical protein [Vibrio sp. V30_P3S12P165]NAX36567.1 hypothetical protein [Vibrio sp. V27_P1S3P104]NAX40432.1 hypothetical protein [Vibrio sp. V26_P1S5P106]NNN43645.1 hypothetical protein [Vibrio sp. 1-1(7)]
MRYSTYLVSAINNIFESKSQKKKSFWLAILFVLVDVYLPLSLQCHVYGLIPQVWRVKKQQIGDVKANQFKNIENRLALANINR